MNAVVSYPVNSDSETAHSTTDDTTGYDSGSVPYLLYLLSPSFY